MANRALSLRSLLVILTIAGCSSSTPSTGASDGGGDGTDAGGGGGGAAGDPCALVSLAEVKGITDVDPVAAKAGTVDTNGKRCNWEDGQGYVLLTLFFHDKVESFEQGRAASSKTVAGLGDDAFIGRVGTIYVKTKGKSFFAQSQQKVKGGVVSAAISTAVGSDSSDDAKTDEAAYRLAKIAVGKL